jgi:hypothetical protein
MGDANMQAEAEANRTPAHVDVAIATSTPFTSSGSRSETQGDASSVGSEQHTAEFTAGNSTSASSSPGATEVDTSSVGTGHVEVGAVREILIRGFGSSNSRRDSDHRTAYTSSSEEMDFPEDEALVRKMSKLLHC